MSQNIDIAVIVGSLRKGSFNRKAATALAKLAPDGVSLRIVEIGDLPLYNEDQETDRPPEAWTRFREAIAPADAILFVTPEYNRSVPGVLKNAFDVGSRPYGSSVWTGKPAAVMTVSPGALGGFGANHHLRQMLVFQDTPILQQPEAYVGNAAALFDERGELASDDTKAFFKSFMDAFVALIKREQAGRSSPPTP